MRFPQLFGNYLGVSSPSTKLPLAQPSLGQLRTGECFVGEFEVVTNPVIFLSSRGAVSENACLAFSGRALKIGYGSHQHRQHGAYLLDGVPRGKVAACE